MKMFRACVKADKTDRDKINNLNAFLHSVLKICRKILFE